MACYAELTLGGIPSVSLLIEDVSNSVLAAYKKGAREQGKRQSLFSFLLVIMAES
jgi:hypothetical protein